MKRRVISAGAGIVLIGSLFVAVLVYQHRPVALDITPSYDKSYPASTRSSSSPTVEPAGSSTNTPSSTTSTSATTKTGNNQAPYVPAPPVYVPPVATCDETEKANDYGIEQAQINQEDSNYQQALQQAEWAGGASDSSYAADEINEVNSTHQDNLSQITENYDYSLEKINCSP